VSNFPPPSGVADEIVAKAVECLDRDVWDDMGDHFVTIRTVILGRADAAITISRSGAEILKYGKPSVPYRDAFREALSRATERERVKRLQPLLAVISDEDKEARDKRKERRDVALTMSAVAVGVLSTIGLVYWGITSASATAAIEEARADEVNKYGFKRGAITSKVTWPDDCAGRGVMTGNDYSTGRDFKSIYECRNYWEDWERAGKMWVDWKDEP
jgi:hypothetical protein